MRHRPKRVWRRKTKKGLVLQFWLSHLFSLCYLIQEKIKKYLVLFLRFLEVLAPHSVLGTDLSLYYFFSLLSNLPLWIFLKSLQLAIAHTQRTWSEIAWKFDDATVLQRRQPTISFKMGKTTYCMFE